MTRLSEKALALFRDTAHAGVLSAEAGDVLTGSAKSETTGDAIRFMVCVEEDTYKTVRYQVYGKPDLVAMSEFVARLSEGQRCGEVSLCAAELIDALSLTQKATPNALLVLEAWNEKA